MQVAGVGWNVLLELCQTWSQKSSCPDWYDLE